MVTAINLASFDHFCFQVNKDGVRQQECYDGGHKHSHQQKIGASLISTQVFQFINTLLQLGPCVLLHVMGPEYG